MAWKSAYKYEFNSPNGLTVYKLKKNTDDTVTEKVMPLQAGSNKLEFASSDEEIGLGWMSYSITLRLRDYVSDSIIDDLKTGDWRLEITLGGNEMPYLFPDFNQLDESDKFINIYRSNLFHTAELVFIDSPTLNRNEFYSPLKTDIANSSHPLHVYNSGSKKGRVPISDLIATYWYDNYNGTEESPLYVNHGIYLDEDPEGTSSNYSASSLGVHILADLLIAPQLFEEHVANEDYAPYLSDVINFFSNNLYAQIGWSWQLNGLVLKELGSSIYENEDLKKLIYSSSTYRSYTTSTSPIHIIDDYVWLESERLELLPKKQYSGFNLSSKFGTTDFTSKHGSESDTNLFKMKSLYSGIGNVLTSNTGMSNRRLDGSFSSVPTGFKHLYAPESYDKIGLDYLSAYALPNIIPDYFIGLYNRKGLKIKISSLIDPIFSFILDGDIYTITKGYIDTKYYTTTILNSSYEPNLGTIE